ncbi:glycosyltransferase family 1 protein [Aggregicoccus sp. 17bor-14]|uniref:glycosyltransferase n=1 Tax=Myxococcaceae TaxID=31 RepID=UPI00129C498B|nr:MULTISPECIES: glycosyltransferase [Myxococcaceae]MBF5041518.1 glycosyltransferase family 1 protein [Simulacricoccus sp. 17bor-14]MRI87303.1 glycosyltransferase family 1 protein [Aggregicoccus sp. 17bor-14]
MSRFLFVMIEGGGNVPPQLAVARRLVARGHEVRVLGDPSLAAGAQRAGCDFAPFRHAPHQDMRSRERDLVRDWEGRSPTQRFARLGEHLFFGPLSRYTRDAAEQLADLRPDAAVVDFLVLGALPAAERSGLPYAVLVHTPFQLPVGGAVPIGLGLRPHPGLLGRTRDRLLWRMLTRMFDRGGLARLNAQRSALGLRPLAHFYEQWLTATRLLVQTSPAFDFPVRLPPNAVYVGPELEDPAWTERSSAPWEPGDARPLVLVSLGSTFQNQQGPTARLIEAVAPLPVRALVTTGGQLTPRELPSAPNVVTVSSVPHAAVLPQAALMACHGGHGSVIKALAHGVPVLSVPLGRDQLDNAARAAALGAGLTASPGSSPARLRRKLQRLLSEPQFRAAARRFAETLRAEQRTDRAVLELEALARRERAGVDASQPRGTAPAWDAFSPDLASPELRP